jgi:hypothetical protein
MKYKDGDPENLGGLGGLLPAEVLKKLNELLEHLHQSDNNKGSTVINIYEKGSMHIDHVDKQNFYGDKYPCPTQPQEDKAPPILPPPLSIPEAMALWQKAQEAGYVDDNYQPSISRTQSALLADAMATRLGIRKKWKVFETLWNRKNMYRDYYKALNLQQSLAFQDEIKNLFR